ncbi:MAG: phospholipase D-like domain-containing protein [Thiobacillus sp.]
MITCLFKRLIAVVLLMGSGFPTWAADAPSSMAIVDRQIAAHPQLTGVYVLDTGEAALRARAWLADHAQHTITVQYFIWSTDNIGILATEALLRAADRGVKVRVIVDDLLIDAPDKSLLALDKHPNIDIRIYNPKHQVGTPFYKRALNVVTDFRGVNQRMHDKTFVVDGKVAITGGRNMADEYFDYDQGYNFRDRDALLLGEAVKTMQTSFDAFWNHSLAVPVATLYDGWGLMQKNVKVGAAEVQQVYSQLHAHARAPENFAPEVRAAINATPETFDQLAREIVWARVDFIHDTPGKNGNRWLLGGGGQTSAALAQLVSDARESIVIQSPYLVMSGKALALFKAAVARGVKVRIITNSLASTDNIQAFSGYRNQRKKLLKMGLQIHEYKPDPANRQALMSRVNPPETPPLFALHAKSMVVDGKIAYIGTFNFDPRSENLNTEVGVVMHHPALARQVQTLIETDMRPENSWNAADAPDQYVPLTKRGYVRLWQLLPLKPLL